jgi:hypothetical protein
MYMYYGRVPKEGMNNLDVYFQCLVMSLTRREMC